MRWVVAGVSFAVSVGLAVTAAAVRSDNVARRAALAEQFRRIQAQRFEFGKWQQVWREASRPAELARHARTLARIRRNSERRDHE